jgi:hypothetical protein
VGKTSMADDGKIDEIMVRGVASLVQSVSLQVFSINSQQINEVCKLCESSIKTAPVL